MSTGAVLIDVFVRSRLFRPYLNLHPGSTEPLTREMQANTSSTIVPRAGAGSLASPLQGLAPLLTVTITILFIIVYGGARLYFTEFFRVFGMTPEQAGVSQAEMLASAGLIFAAFGLIWTTAVLFGVAQYKYSIWVDKRFGTLSKGSSRVQQLRLGILPWLPILVVAVIVGPTLVLLQPSLFIFDQPLLTSAVAGAVIGLFQATLAESASTPPPRTSGVAGGKRQPPLRLFGWAIVAGALLIVLSNLLVVGNNRAYELLHHAPDLVSAPQPVTGREGRSQVKGTSLFALPVSVFPAHVIPLTRDPLRLCEAPRLGYVLGRQGGTSYLLIGPFQGWGAVSASPAQVFPLRDIDYAVLTGVTGLQLC